MDNKLTKPQLLEAFSRLSQQMRRDPQSVYDRAVELLVEYIDDPEIESAFDDLT